MSGTQANHAPNGSPLLDNGPLATVNWFAEKSTPVLIFLAPALLLWVRSGTNICFAILLLVTFYRLAIPNSGILRQGFDRADMLFGAAMVSLVVATFLSQTYHQNFALSPYDSVLRFLYVIPVYVLLRQTDFSQISILHYGVVIGALLSPFVPWLIPGDPAHWGTVRASSYFLSPIHYGELALILGFVSLFSINWLGRDRTPLIVIKLAALGAGVVASFLTGSRGGWVAIPVLLFMWLHFSLRRNLLLAVILTLVGMTLVAILAIMLSPQISARVSAIVNELVSYRVGDAVGSASARLEMWRVSIAVTLRESPIFGLGPDQFPVRAQSLVAQGVMTKELADLATSELHSELVAKFVSLGLIGLGSIIAIYLVPAVLFVKALRSPHAFRRGAARMGLCFVIGFFVFGLTVETFNLKMVATFYSFMVAVLLAGALNRDPELRNESVAPAAAN